MMSPTDTAFGNRSILGAMKIATRISLMLKPHSTTMLATP